MSEEARQAGEEARQAARSLLGQLERYQALVKGGLGDTIATPGFVMSTSQLRLLAEEVLAS